MVKRVIHATADFDYAGTLTFTRSAVPRALEALRQGGNAMDAAVAAAAALTVVEPTANGLGSDAFALIWSEKEHRLFGLNASGPAPMLADADKVLAQHRDAEGKLPRHGWTPVTVPGAVGAWAAITKRFGRRSLSRTGEAVFNYRDKFPFDKTFFSLRGIFRRFCRNI